MTTHPARHPDRRPDPELLTAAGLCVAHGGTDVLHDLDLVVEPRTITALVGPNGSGKSTLLGALARLHRPRSGEVRLAGRPLRAWSSTAVARRLALLPQSSTPPPRTTVRELVEQGRYPQRGAWSMLRQRDDALVDAALERAGVADLADRRVEALSGGERQRAWIAMCLAQDTGLVLLDEPTTYLDVRHQVGLMRLVESLRDDDGKTLVLVLHDLNQAARHADRVVALSQGRVVADGTPDEVVTEALLRDVFGVDALVQPDPVTGRPLFVPR